MNKPSGSEVKDGVIWNMLENSASPVSFSEDCQHVRIGAQVFTLSREGTYITVPGLDAETDNGARYVEELVGRGRYVILASRKAQPAGPGENGEGPLPDHILHFVVDVGDDDDDTAMEDVKAIILDKNGQPVSSTFNITKGSDGETTPDGDNKSKDKSEPKKDKERTDESSSDEDEDEDEDSSEDYTTDEESEARESWSECSSEDTADSQFEDEKRTPWASLLGQEAQSEIETSESEPGSDSSQDSSEVSPETAESSESEEPEKTAVGEESTTGTKVDDSEDSSEEESDLPRGAFFGFRQAWRDEDDDNPDWNGSDDAPAFEHRYIAHGIRKKRANGDDSQPQVFISVFDTSKASPERVFTFSPSLAFLLHDSPPAVHPTAPLAVWPLSTGNILFADFENNSYFIRKLRPSTLYSMFSSLKI